MLVITILIDDPAIRRCRDGAWNVVKQRRHTVLRVYAHDAHALDLLLIGNVEMNLANGKYVAGEFIARVLLVEAEADSPRIKLYQVWAVCIPYLQGYRAAVSDQGLTMCAGFRTYDEGAAE
jgi:hypothetical protein